LVTIEKPDGSRHELSENRHVEVSPGVHMPLGLKNQIGTASLVFEASTKVVILTEKNYRALRPQSRRGRHEAGYRISCDARECASAPGTPHFSLYL
jgi:hypothetical protein